ncbi:hypothetical protein V6N11_050002 [Hibiscus sabdariffa]|uniref:Receptor-like protein 12 n=1 Tax=Hibiscus sabdariffa TaxID=183260 RepID=A0ABR2T9I7_9ROSI
MNLSGCFHSIFHLHHLQRLNLAGNNFNSTLLSYGFGKLPNLTHLNLSSSCFHGQIPIEMSYLTRLVSLDLSNQDHCYRGSDDDYDLHTLKLEKPNLETLTTNLRYLEELYLNQSSKWCETISLALSNLRVLSLSNCGLEGPLCSSLSTLTFLSKLVLDYNLISSLPTNFLEISSRLVDCSLSGHFPTEILLLPKIQSIDISDNVNLMGQLPEFSSNNALRSLSLSATNFGGKLPESIRNLKFLTDLTLSGCYFFGSIPSSIANLSHLMNLDLLDNSFRGLIPPFHRLGVPNLSNLNLPSSLFTLPSLQTLFLDNNQLFGKIDEFPNASSSLMVMNNYLTGSFSKSILQLPRLEWLYIDGNNFSSLKLDSSFHLNNLRGLGLSNVSLLIESDSKNLTFSQLENLFLRSCNLTEFPEFIKTLDKLTDLDLSNNHIHGLVPHWLWKSSLSWVELSFNPIDFPVQLPLDLASNQFSGELSIDFLHATQLRSLKIGGNKLEGKLPTSLANCTKLEVLDLGNNMIHDTFPFWLEKLPSLKVLILRGNKFYGTITKTDSEHGFPKLRILDIASNNFLGRLPTEFLHSLKALMQITNGDKARLEYIRENIIVGLYYQDSVTIVNKGIEMFYEKVLTIFTCLDLSNNSFHERIPEEIRILMPLKVLNLSYNSFSGEIPSALDNLKDLESLDLSQNKLLGKIPPQLASLTFLAALNLSYNQLEGSIPQSNQFTTFTNDSFQGNPKLCGPPLSRKYNEVGFLMPTSPGEDENDSWLDAMSTWKILWMNLDKAYPRMGMLRLPQLKLFHFHENTSPKQVETCSSRLMQLVQILNGLGIAGWGVGGTEV